MTRRIKTALAAVFTVALVVAIAQDYVKRGVRWAEGQIFGLSAHETCVNDALAGIGRDTNTALTVVFTRLRLDTNGVQSERIGTTLETIFAASDQARLIRMPCVLIDESGDLAALEKQAATRAQSIANRTGADVVIWGGVRRADAALDLRLTHARGDNRDLFEVEDVQLSPAFAEALGGIIAARAVDLIRLEPGQSGTYLVPLMQQILTILAPLAADPPRGMAPGDLGDLLEAAARAQHWLGLQTGADLSLREAVANYERARDAYETANDNRQIARVQNNLGNALAELGSRTGDDALLRDAIAAYAAALEEYTRDRVPLNWAMTQNNLGTALDELGSRTGDEALLRDAIAAYRAALEERTRDRVPLDWARAQNNLGAALQELGSRTGDEALLRHAIAAYTEALEEFTRDRVPISWAMTQGNLGNVHESLYTLSRDPADKAAALTHARAAVEVFAELGAAGYLARATRNLARIEALE